jgi:Nucleotidyl transferase AbiEii toxin, Type IV TA system
MSVARWKNPSLSRLSTGRSFKAAAGCARRVSPVRAWGSAAARVPFTYYWSAEEVLAFGEPMLGEPDVVAADDVLAFAGIAPPTLRLYPIETHIAEKLHAYTLPRRRPNSRVKDLPDLALLATAGPLDAVRLRAALEQTFAFRKTHALPAAIPDAPPRDTQGHGHHRHARAA